MLNTILNGILSIALFGKTDHTLAGYDTVQFLAEHFPELRMQSEKLLEQTSLYHDEPLNRKRTCIACRNGLDTSDITRCVSETNQNQTRNGFTFSRFTDNKKLIKMPFQGFL